MKSKLDGSAAFGVHDLAGVVAFGKALTPGAKRQDDGCERAAFLGEQVLVTIGEPLIATSLEDAGFGEFFQATRQDVVRDAGGFELVESPSAEDGIANDEQGPPFTNDVERSSDRTGLVRQAYVSHEPQSSNLHEASQRGIVAFFTQVTTAKVGKLCSKSPAL
jgi:hypothetical protein